jgi:hypothetical protein
VAAELRGLSHALPGLLKSAWEKDQEDRKRYPIHTEWALSHIQERVLAKSHKVQWKGQLPPPKLPTDVAELSCPITRMDSIGRCNTI